VQLPVKTEWIECVINKLAPTYLAEEWDNVGLLVGRKEKMVSKILIALDLTEDVLNEAIEIECDIIITHHPLIFKPLKNITDKTPIGKRIITLLKNDISLYTAHTNLDIANGGTNDILFEILGLQNKEFLWDKKYENESFGMGRVGEVAEPIDFKKFIIEIKEKLCLKNINYVNSNDNLVKRVALCTGSASDMKYILKAKEKKCDTYITGDVTYHNGHFALDMGVNIIDATHFGTENIFCNTLKNYILNEAKKDKLKIDVLQSRTTNKVFKNI
jgi:dinuclear metal center YbgI/SA1388 family protein